MHCNTVQLLISYNIRYKFIQLLIKYTTILINVSYTANMTQICINESSPINTDDESLK